MLRERAQRPGEQQDEGDAQRVRAEKLECLFLQ